MHQQVAAGHTANGDDVTDPGAGARQRALRTTSPVENENACELWGSDGVLIDLHWGIIEPYFGMAIDFDRLLSRARSSTWPATR